MLVGENNQQVSPITEVARLFMQHFTKKQRGWKKQVYCKNFAETREKSHKVRQDERVFLRESSCIVENSEGFYRKSKFNFDLQLPRKG